MAHKVELMRLARPPERLRMSIVLGREPGLHEGVAAHQTSVRDAGDFDDVLRQQQLVEPVRIVDAVPVGETLGRDAATAARDYPSSREEEVARIVVVQLLVVHVAGNHHVDAVLLVQFQPVVRVPCGRMVCDEDLPTRRGLAQALLKPLVLVGPQLLEPTGAGPDVLRTHLAATDAIHVEVRTAANVVFRVCMGLVSAEGVGVQEPVVH
mmetsp:Transcript_48588/g.123244  ORF Transcript_48588/g.123244 Transcript_48588/m.123244 type:complete len:209 (-) Transcript_48588:1423-2049(-)